MTARDAASSAWKTLLVIHRYLGVAAALVMVGWCLSGFVMMYHGYPRLAEADRLRALDPVRLTKVCDPASLGLPPGAEVSAFSLEMAAGAPRLALRLKGAPSVGFDLATCARASPPTSEQARRTVALFAQAAGVIAPVHDRGIVVADQWTVNGASSRGPTRRFSFDDPEHTDVYVAQRTGQVAQRTTRTDRVLGWLGAVPHWLYPTLLRRNGKLWNDVVVWTSLLGSFLTATGLYVGIARLRPYRSGRWSPYRGWFLWHHVLGLVFGVLTLTWVITGFLTMTPWGLPESEAFGVWRGRIVGEMTAEDVARFLSRAASQARPGVVRYESAPLHGQLFVTAVDRQGSRTRLDRDAGPAPLQGVDLARALGPAASPLARQEREDAYYYAGYDAPAPLPVLRAQMGGSDPTMLYFDPASGALLRAVDSSERVSRWTRTALHDWDFPWLRARPLWDVVVLFLLAGVTSVCGVGAWLGLRRAIRDIGSLRAR